MHVRRGALGWGVFLILAGSIPLLVRAGVLSDDQVSDLWTLWPVILIGLGVGLLLGRTRFEFLGGLIVAATFGLIVGGLLSSGVNGVTAGACGSSQGAQPFAERSGAFASGAADVEVKLDCGDLTIDTEAGDLWHVRGSSRDGDAPSVDDEVDSLTIRPNNGGGLFGIFATRSTWQVTLGMDALLDLSIDANAGTARVGLPGARLGELKVGLNAGSTTLDLSSIREIGLVEVELNAGSAGISLPNLSMTGSIEANAGSIRICAPAGVGLRIETGGSVAASYDFPRPGPGRVRLDLAWVCRGARSDRPPDGWHGRIVHVGSGGWLRWMTGCIDRWTTGCWPAWPVAWRNGWMPIPRSSASCGPSSSS